MTDHFTTVVPEPPLAPGPRGFGAFQRGELSLPRTYWLWGVGVSVLIALPVGFVIGIVQAVEAPRILVGLLLLVMVAWNWIVVRAVFRSAAHYQGAKGWAVAARVFVVLGFIVNIIQFAQTFFNPVSL